MGKKGEIAVAHMLNMFQSHPWLFFKVKMLQRVHQNFASWFPEIEVEDEGTSLVHQMIRLEIMVTTVHYAEVLAANLLAFKRKRKRFHKTLLSYEGRDIIDFYRRIKRRKLSYVANLLGYPALFQIPDEEQREPLIESCKHVRQKLSEIAEYYLTYNSLYNAYKHGFRVGVGQQAPPSEIAPDFKPYTFIMWPPDKEKLDEVTLLRKDSTQKEIDMCGFMYSVLNSVTNTFVQRILNKKEIFTAVVLNEQGLGRET